MPVAAQTLQAAYAAAIEEYVHASRGFILQAAYAAAIATHEHEAHHAVLQAAYAAAIFAGSTG